MPDFPIDAVFFTNQLRYDENIRKIKNIKIMATSNLNVESTVIIFNYMTLIKFGWINIDNSTILALRLFINCGARDFYFAGLDGFIKQNNEYYYDKHLLNSADEESLKLLVKETKEMLVDIRENTHIKAVFLTPSAYEDVFQKEKSYV